MKQKENYAWCAGESKRWKGNIKEGSRDGKTGIVLPSLDLEHLDPIVYQDIDGRPTN